MDRAALAGGTSEPLLVGDGPIAGDRDRETGFLGRPARDEIQAPTARRATSGRRYRARRFRAPLQDVESARRRLGRGRRPIVGVRYRHHSPEVCDKLLCGRDGSGSFFG